MGDGLRAIRRRIIRHEFNITEISDAGGLVMKSGNCVVAWATRFLCIAILSEAKDLFFAAKCRYFAQDDKS